MGHCILPKTFPDLWGISIYFLWAIQSTVYCYCSPNRRRHPPWNLPASSTQISEPCASVVFPGSQSPSKASAELPFSITLYLWPLGCVDATKISTQESAFGWNLHHVTWSLNFRSTLCRDNWTFLCLRSMNGDKGSTVVGIARSGASHSSTCTMSFGAELQVVDISWLVFYSVLLRDFSPSRASFRTSPSISPEITHVKQGSHHPLTHRKPTTLLRAKTTPRRGRRKCIP